MNSVDLDLSFSQKPACTFNNGWFNVSFNRFIHLTFSSFKQIGIRWVWKYLGNYEYIILCQTCSDNAAIFTIQRDLYIYIPLYSNGSILQSKLIILNLSQKQMLSNASATDDFWKNPVAKGEIAHNEQFLLLPQCFQLFSIIKPLFMEISHNV